MKLELSETSKLSTIPVSPMMLKLYFLKWHQRISIPSNPFPKVGQMQYSHKICIAHVVDTRRDSSLLVNLLQKPYLQHYTMSVTTLFDHAPPQELTVPSYDLDDGGTYVLYLLWQLYHQGSGWCRCTSVKVASDPSLPGLNISASRTFDNLAGAQWDLPPSLREAWRRLAPEILVARTEEPFTST